MGRLHGPPFSARRAGHLDGLGAAGPNLQTKKVSRTAGTNKNENKRGSRRSVSIATATPGRGTDCRPETGLKGHPQELQHSAANGGKRDRVPPAKGSLHLREGSLPNGRDPASRLFRDLRALATPAKAGEVEPIPAKPDASIKVIASRLWRRRFRRKVERDAAEFPDQEIADPRSLSVDRAASLRHQRLRKAIVVEPTVSNQKLSARLASAAGQLILR